MTETPYSSTPFPMLLDAPFHPAPDYLDFLQVLGGMVHSVHFSMHSLQAPDARPLLNIMDPGELAASLAALPGPKKYALLNSRFHPMAFYSSPQGLEPVAELLETLLDAGVVDGIVFSDALLLTALSDAYPDLAGCLEAVPGANCCLDSPEKALAMLEQIGRTRFLPPGKVVLDRSLNRRPERLEQTSLAVRNIAPEVLITLLANEGCLPHCPFKPAHDALMAHCRAEGGMEDMHKALRELACLKVFHAAPWRMLASPVIRPEDMLRYQGLAQVMKICGRTRGPLVLTRLVSAYARGEWAGNYLNLCDVLECLAPTMHLDNQALPKGFFRKVTTCSGACGECGYCRELTRQLLEQRGPLPDPESETEL